MPVEVLGLQIERKGVRQQRVERRRNFFHRGLRQIGRRIEIGGYLVGFAGFAHVAPSCRKFGIGGHWTLPAGPSNASEPSRFLTPEPPFRRTFHPWINGSIITIQRIRSMRASC